jgi:hypothetical protein
MRKFVRKSEAPLKIAIYIPLLNAIKEPQRQLDQQRRENSRLQQILDAQRRELDSIEKLVCSTRPGTAVCP